MKHYFVSVRYWPGFPLPSANSIFPFERFDVLDDIELELALEKYGRDRLGETNRAIKRCRADCEEVNLPPIIANWRGAKKRLREAMQKQSAQRLGGPRQMTNPPIARPNTVTVYGDSSNGKTRGSLFADLDPDVPMTRDQIAAFDDARDDDRRRNASTTREVFQWWSIVRPWSWLATPFPRLTRQAALFRLNGKGG